MGYGFGFGISKVGKVLKHVGTAIERADTLSGARNSSPAAETKMAITRQDAAQQGVIKLQSQYVTTTPTAEQHNALVHDLLQVALVLNKMGAKFTGL